MSKVSKKGKHPGTVDVWLDSLGLYRKNVAYDETSLFRCVSEQLFNCQMYHERVRKECIAYARENYELFKYMFKSKDKFDDHLDQLEKHMVICGDIEIDIISRKYEVDVVIFDAAQQKVYDATKRDKTKSVLLCFLDKDHYDVIYKKEHIVTAGFCQSLIYKTLYQDVFKIENVDEIVHNMLYEKNTITTQAELQLLKPKLKIEGEEIYQDDSRRTEHSSNIAPFPFKVAKALDPNIYRNIEYDTWGEVRRELRLSEWYYGDNKLVKGTRCIFTDTDGVKLNGYIQELIKDQNKCVIYLIETAEKKMVNYEDLSPESDAKPWPLPYRFMRSLVITPSQNQRTSTENKTVQKPNKKRNKKHLKVDSNVLSILPVTSQPVENYVGVPLQMQPPPEPQSANQTEEPTSETQTDYNSITQEAEDVQETSTAQDSYTFSWQPTYATPVTPETPYFWPQTPELRPVVSSAPVTPNVIPFNDNYPVFYQITTPPCTPYAYPWVYRVPDQQQYQEYHTRPSMVDLQDQATYMPESPISNQTNDSYPSTPSYQLSQSYQSSQSNQTSFDTSVEVSPSERPKITLKFPSATYDNVKMFSPVLTVPAGTSMVYATAPQEVTEVVMPGSSSMLPTTPVIPTPPVMPTTPLVYAPPGVDYVSRPAPFVYSHTPPATWYPTQGFAFPSPRHT